MSINIEIFSSPGCGKYSHAKEVLRKLADELGGDKIRWRKVNILDEVSKINQSEFEHLVGYEMLKGRNAHQVYQELEWE